MRWEGREGRGDEKGGKERQGWRKESREGVGGENKESVMQDWPLSQTAAIFMRAAVPV